MYTHSVTLEKDKCIGCTDCIKRCPTEAIRVRQSKAKIIDERCIDCGNCIRICGNGAKKAITDELSILEGYHYRIALVAPSFYAQFPKALGIEWILQALLEIGFTDYFEVAVAAEAIAIATYDYIKEASIFPIISSSCPAIVRLIQRRFPSLIDHILPIISPMELAARYVKKTYEERGTLAKEVGIFFISPCPAKATEIHRPKGIEMSMVDGVISMQTLYKLVASKLNKVTPTRVKESTYKGISWATRNGGIDENSVEGHIAVDGIENVISILEKVEDGTLGSVNYIEALACTGGCLGGALTVENAFVSKNTLKKWIRQGKTEGTGSEGILLQKIKKEPSRFEKAVRPRKVFQLDDDRVKALKKAEELESFYSRLPKIDCGACGAPTCRCFAEDVVRELAREEECVFLLRSRIRELSRQMHELTQYIVPTEKNQKRGDE